MRIKKLLKWLGIAVGVMILLVVVLSFLVRLPAVQTWIAQKVTTSLSNQLGTKVTIDHLQVDLISSFDLTGFYIEDKGGDTLVYINEANGDISLFSMFGREIAFEELSINSARLYIERKEGQSQTNLDQIFSANKDSTNQKTNDPWQIDIQEIQIADLSIINADSAKREILYVDIPTGKIDLNHFGITEMKFDVALMDLQDLYVRQDRYNKTESSETSITDTSSAPTLVVRRDFLPSNMELFLEELAISNGTVELHNLSEEPINDEIDLNHLVFSNLNARTSNTFIYSDTITGSIDTLSMFEKCGLNFHELKGGLLLSTTELTIDTMMLRVNESVIRDKISLSYSAFSDFKNFETEVYMRAEMKGATITGEDLKLFAPEVDPIAHNNMEINGIVRGTVDNLKGRNLVLEINEKTFFDGNFSIKGLPNINEAFINLKVNELRTTKNLVEEIYPYVRYPKELGRMGNLSFSGKFDGFLSDFVTDGLLLTDIGALSTDINFKINSNTDQAEYSGNLAVNALDIGKLIDQEQLFGSLSMNTKVTGSGLRLDVIDATLTGTVDAFKVNGYNYKDATINGTFDKREFRGEFDIDDNNITLDFDGLVDFNGELPKFNFNANIENLQLDSLRFTKRPYRAKAKLVSDFTGNNIDNIVGQAELYDLIIQRDDLEHQIDSVVLLSEILANGDKRINLLSDNINARVEGQFKFEQIPLAVRKFLSEYSNQIVFEDESLLDSTATSFDFDIEVVRLNKLLRFTESDLKRIQNSTISGKFNSQDNELALNAQIPEMWYQDFKLQSIDIQTDSLENSLGFTAKVASVKLNDSLIMQDILATTDITRDTILFSAFTRGKNYDDFLKIGGQLRTQNDLWNINLNTSELVLNEKKWDFRTSNIISIGSDTLFVKDLDISHAEQSISASTYNRQGQTNLKLDVSNLLLEDFSNIFSLKENIIYGLANGKVNIEDLYGGMSITSNLNIAKLAVNDDAIGDFQVVSTFSPAEEKVYVDAELLGGINDVNFRGYYFTDRAEDNLDFKVDIGKFKIEILNNYLQDLMSNGDGILTADLNLKGSFKEPLLTGTVHLDNAELTVPFINTHYYLNDETITLKNDHFDLTGVVIRDIEGNQAFMNGKIYHEHLQDLRLDLSVNTSNFQLLNTTPKDFKVFNGTAFGKGVVYFQGPPNIVDIVVEATSMPGTHIKIPISDDSETGVYDFYRFINLAEDTVYENTLETGGKVTILLDLLVTEDAKIDLILDQQAGDALEVRGSGRINLVYDELEDFYIYGLYEIIKGEYLFTLQRIVNKEFRIEPGGKIIFTGDIYEADVDISAIYGKTNFQASPYNLIYEYLGDGDDDAIRRAQNTTEVDLFLNIDGVLKQPEITFDFDLPQVDPAIRNLVETKLQILRNDENELNKQVFAILILNSFVPTYAGTGANNPAAISGASNTVSEFLSARISVYLSDWISTFVTDLDFNVRYSNYSATSGDESSEESLRRNEIYVAASKRFFNDRISVTVGGNFDFGDQISGNETGSTSTFIAGDFKLEYRLTPDGRIRVFAFNRGEYDIFEQGGINETGVGISYTRDFDRIGEIFNSDKKKKKDE